VRTVIDWEAMDFFRDDGLVADPYPYFDALRGQCRYGANLTTAW